MHHLCKQRTATSKRLVRMHVPGHGDQTTGDVTDSTTVWYARSVSSYARWMQISDCLYSCHWYLFQQNRKVPWTRVDSCAQKK